MLGFLLFLVSMVCVSRALGGPSPSARVAAAALAALMAPVLVLCVAARLGLNVGAAGVVAAHAGLWALALRRARGNPSPGPPGATIAPFALALGVASLSGLLGRDPAQDALNDPWAHLAWSRDLAGALPLYPPGFPAFVRSMTLDHPLVGAFRAAAAAVHVVVAAQFLALAAVGGRTAGAALLALVYLVVPVSQGKFEPPRPEVLAAALVAASWWILLARDLTPRARNLALGAVTLGLLVVHVSALEMAHLAALAAAVGLGASREQRWRARAVTIAWIGLGAVLSLAISPWPWTVVFRPEDLPLVASQPGEVSALAWRPVVLLLGLDLVALVVAAASWAALARPRIDRPARVALGALGLAALLLLAPLPLASWGLQLPLQLFPQRLVLSAALPLCLAAALVFSYRSGHARLDRALGVGLILAYTAYKLWRPGVGDTRILLAGIVLAGVLVLLRWSRSPRWMVPATALLAAAALGLRMWIWTPHEPAVVGWLRAADEPEAPVVTNWPGTNALDALVSRHVLDGLAGRDAAVGLHRVHRIGGLHEAVSWCGSASDSAGAALAAYLDSRGWASAYLVVDPRFEEAWRDYAQAREHVVRTRQLERYPFLQPPPCRESARSRLEGIHETLDRDAHYELVHREEGVTVYRFHRAVPQEGTS